MELHLSAKLADTLLPRRCFPETQRLADDFHYFESVFYDRLADAGAISLKYFMRFCCIFSAV